MEQQHTEGMENMTEELDGWHFVTHEELEEAMET
jgi:hypothetical protein